jgi:hypothetical protein
MSAQDGPPQGMETKNVPGYVPAQTVSGDHPGHSAGFAGSPGYTNTPGILDPEEKSSDEKPATKKATAPAKSSGTAADKNA